MTHQEVISGALLRLLPTEQASRDRFDPVDRDTLLRAQQIVEDVQSNGADAFHAYVAQFGDRAASHPAVLSREMLQVTAKALDPQTIAHLQGMVDRIESFAIKQRAALSDVDVPVPGGRAGHRVYPLETAGCYAPGGRYPLPSSVAMTAVTARAAGVADVTVASPNPSVETIAAAYLSGADRLLVAGGAHAVAALAYGVPGVVDPVDVIVGPGNRWVTAAKKLVSGRVRIDMLAGPSELLIIADDSANPETIAADLLAQAEHDTDAAALLVALDPSLPARVNVALEAQLADLPTAETAKAALRNGWACVVDDESAAMTLSDSIAPEHLQLLCAPDRAIRLRERLRSYGGLFIGHRTAEVFGDYGIGPNHTLPTGGTARYTGGLSVYDFLAVRTWLEMDTPDTIAETTATLARLEGLEAHARAAERRLR